MAGATPPVPVPPTAALPPDTNELPSELEPPLVAVSISLAPPTADMPPVAGAPVTVEELPPEARPVACDEVSAEPAVPPSSSPVVPESPPTPRVSVGAFVPPQPTVIRKLTTERARPSRVLMRGTLIPSSCNTPLVGALPCAPMPAGLPKVVFRDDCIDLHNTRRVCMTFQSKSVRAKV